LIIITIKIIININNYINLPVVWMVSHI
jgi:hypothetical protein